MLFFEQVAYIDECSCFFLFTGIPKDVTDYITDLDAGYLMAQQSSPIHHGLSSFIG